METDAKQGNEKDNDGIIHQQEELGKFHLAGFTTKADHQWFFFGKKIAATFGSWYN